MQPDNVVSTFALGQNLEPDIFQIAISFAENGVYVLIIAPEIFKRTPNNVKKPDNEVSKLITFKYLKDHNDLITLANGIHLWPKPPSVIIVTNFGHYCNFLSPNYNPLQVALVTTSLLDSAAVCAMKKKEKIFLLVTSAPVLEEGKNRLQVIKDLYFSNFIEHHNSSEFCNNVIKLFM